MKKLYILSSIALAGFMTSCYDLDTQPMSSTITEEQRQEIIDQDPSRIDGLSDGIYKYYNEFGWFAGDYYDFGYPGIMLQLESRTGNFLSANADIYGWFSSCAEYTDNTASSGYNAVRWGWSYGIISACNQLLGYIDEDTDNDYYKYLRGQAYGNRAFAYWVLAQLFQFNYVGHQDDLCVPIITEKNQEEAAREGMARATVQEVYDQILRDLQNGINLMTNNSSAVRIDKRYIDINVLYGLRARAYLCMQNYEAAAADAQTVINSRAFTPLSPEEAIGPGFISITDPNWIWGIYYYMEDVMGLYTLSGMMGSYTYGYAYAGMWKCITDVLFDAIPYGDARKLWWIDPSTGVSNAAYFTDAIGDADLGVSTAIEYLEVCGFPGYAVTKFAPYQNQLGQSNNQADVPLMRIEEMYLILAECQYKGGLGDYVNTLESFVNNYRWLDKTTPYTFASQGRSFDDEIYIQRQVELWGEGMAYFDILRLDKGVERRGTTWSDPTYGMDAYDWDIEPGNNILIMQIPTSEMDNNPKIQKNNEPGTIY